MSKGFIVKTEDINLGGRKVAWTPILGYIFVDTGDQLTQEEVDAIVIKYPEFFNWEGA